MISRRRQVLIGLVAAILIPASIYVSGILVKPNIFTVDKLVEVPDYDVLEWQHFREQQLLAEGAVSTYTDPFVMIDPYAMNPLSAIVLFKADQAATYTITVDAPNDYAKLVTRVDREAGIVALPIIGLYPQTANTVIINNGQDEVILTITTDRLPRDFQDVQRIASSPERMQPGFTLFVACFDHSYTALIDQDGAVRGYFSNTSMAHGTSVITLSNGHLLSTGDELKQVPYHMTSLWEFDWLGKIYSEIEIPNGIHHDVSELDDGTLLVVSNNANMFQTGTREDVAIIVDPLSGEVIKTYDFRTILDENRDPYTNFHPNILNALNIDWMHMNAALIAPDYPWLIVSSPIQSQVVAIDRQTQDIQWILGPHEGYEGSAAKLAPYLLTPIGEPFEWSWAQHHPMILNDVDNDPDTIDLVMLDNGQVRSFTEAGATAPQDNYSRAVHYRIHVKNMTVEQIWDYGTARGNELYATFLGDANRLSNGNTLITFGGQLKQNGVTVDKILDGVLGDSIVTSRVVEVDLDHNVVFEVAVLNNQTTTSAETYQAVRMDLTKASVGDHFGQKGQRVGSIVTLAQDTTLRLPNLYFGSLGGSFNKLVREGNRLVIDGNIRYNNNIYLLGQANIVLRSWDRTYVFKSNSGLNGRYFSSIDLSTLEPGVYEISIAGGIREGYDVLSGTLHKGMYRTGYKVSIARSQ